MSTLRTVVVTGACLGLGVVLSVGCEPRHRNGGGAAAPTNSVASTAVPTATTTFAPTVTTTACADRHHHGTHGHHHRGADHHRHHPARRGHPHLAHAERHGPERGRGHRQEHHRHAGWRRPPPRRRPATAIAASIKATAAKAAPGFTAAGPIGKANLKTGEHAGMVFNFQPGKCYIAIGAGGPGVNKVALFLTTTPTGSARPRPDAGRARRHECQRSWALAARSSSPVAGAA